MNCLEFRREKLADPRRVSAKAQAHAGGCPTCMAFAREVDETELALDRALLVPVPEGLADRIIFQSRNPHRAWRAWALAAGMLLAVALGLSFWNTERNSQEYARVAIEHVMMEPESLTTVRQSDPDAFRAIVHNLGGAVKELPGRVRYIRLCPIEGGFGWHIVFETPDGLATLFIVPGKNPKAVQSASVGGLNAAVHPTRGGYYAIVTASPAATSRFYDSLRESIVWRT